MSTVTPPSRTPWPPSPTPRPAVTPPEPTGALAFLVPTRAAPERSLRALGPQSLLQARRLLTRWLRDPFTTIQALVYPAVTLVMLWVVLGDSIADATGQDALDGLVPMTALVGTMAGAVAGAVSLMGERDSGLVGRFWVMPVNRAGPIVGRLLAEMVRILLTTVIIVAVGLLIGFRFDRGLLAGLAMVGMPLLFGLGYSTLATAAALYSRRTTFVEMLSLATTILMFFNTGFVPLDAYPSWLQGPVQYQPMSCAVDTMKALAVGGPTLTPLLLLLAWTGGLVVVFGWPAIVGYGRAAGSARR
ncbi:ABC transporter permease [Rhodococcus sp. X156]|uniref:ABC transporter permease n=1 Tax=Rhodococcus sp. X156 TaxID=2499145 RepID=UPI000FD88BEF|nr:ABC transporter permease [Rhodococcus sp. X156]